MWKNIKWNRRDLLDRIITFVSIMALMLALNGTHNHDTAIGYDDSNESITYTNNYYDLSYHATHFIFYVNISSFVKKHRRDIVMTVLSGPMKCCTSVLIQ